MSQLLRFFLILFFAVPVVAEQTRYWNLPVELSDQNATVRFNVDSTWHMVHGTTSGVSGKLWLQDLADYNSIRGQIQLPVARFNTDSESRDEEMREVMAETKFPQVSMRLEGAEDMCRPERYETQPECGFHVQAELSIRGVSKKVSVPVVMKKSGNGYIVNGSFTIRWPDFGVEDPSIFIARLDPEVTIAFEVKL